jgi:hypothetical protein
MKKEYYTQVLLPTNKVDPRILKELQLALIEALEPVVLEPVVLEPIVSEPIALEPVVLEPIVLE